MLESVPPAARTRDISMWKIAWSNLVHDKLRFGAALFGLVLAVVLIAVQAAIYFGALASSSLLARAAAGDLWVVPRHASNADFSAPMTARRRYQALGVPGVERAGRMAVGVSVLRFATGRQEPVIVVGTDTDFAWLPIDPQLIRGRTADGRPVVLDERERRRFAPDGQRELPVGVRGEMSARRAVVSGFVRGMASFTITPYVFASFEAAQEFARIDRDQTIFVMVRCAPGADHEAVRRELTRRIPDVEVLTRDEFAARSWRYWVMGTGMGFSLMLMAALALVVGLTIVGQTFLTGVRVKIREFAVLKALGFSNPFVAGVIVAQGLIVALLGYALGCAGALLVSYLTGAGGTAVTMAMPPLMFVALLPLTLGICVVASLAGAWSVFRLAPAEVFR